MYLLGKASLSKLYRGDLDTVCGSSRVMIYLGCVTIGRAVTISTRDRVRAGGDRAHSARSAGARPAEGGNGRGRGGTGASLDQVSPTRLYKEQSPPLPVLS